MSSESTRTAGTGDGSGLHAEAVEESPPHLEHVTHEGVLLAIILRARHPTDGVRFFAPDDGLLQMGYMSRPRGHHIPPHVHTPYRRVTEGTHEVLFVKKGRMRVDLYRADHRYVTSRELDEGDFVLLCGEGHGFEMLEPTTFIEIKNGPYAGDEDKVRFDDAEERP